MSLHNSLTGADLHVGPVVRKNSVDVAGRRKINFIESSSVSFTIIDDAGGDEVEITPSFTGSIIGAEGTDASLLLDADEGDDPTDSWFIKSEASGNDLSFTNDTSKLLSITSDGRLYGTALHNNAGSLTGTTTQYIASGTYTPTLFNTTNLDGSTSHQGSYKRVGNIVDVDVTLEVDPTLVTTLTQLGISLPIASNFTSEYECNGQGNSSTSSDSGRVYADPTNDRAVYEFTSITTSNHKVGIHFSYEVK